jgi:hypothetical protein
MLKQSQQQSTEDLDYQQEMEDFNARMRYEQNLDLFNR